MEALKPLVVLVLFGTILYGAYSVVQKGPSATPEHAAATDAPPFAPPAVELAAPTPPPMPAMPAPPPMPAMPAMTPAAAPATASQPAAPVSQPAATIAANPVVNPPPSVPPPPAMPATPPGPLVSPATVAVAAAGAAIGAAAVEPPSPANAAPTYLTAESAPPPAPDSIAPAVAPPGAGGERPDRFATIAATPPVSAGLLPGGAAPPPSSAASGSSAAFATAWADAHEKLAAGRYAEALAGLSIWYDDPSLGLEESQRLEDLLGQLAGTVIYSQQDLLMPPHVVAAGETLPAVALQLGISWQLLGKINGVANPQDLIPGEHLKVIRGPFDAVVSVSRRRLSLQLGGNYAGSFPVAVGRQLLTRVGSSIPVTDVRRGSGRDVQTVASLPGDPTGRPSIVLADGLVIEAAEDPGIASDTSPPTSLVVSVRDLAELLDILGPGSKVLIRQ